jgi:hypothetical protein
LRFVLVEAFFRTHHAARWQQAGPCGTPAITPARFQALKQWQTAMRCLIEAADHGGSVMNARIGVSRALRQHLGHNFDPIQKTPDVPR